jgi:hypothetical protein
MGITRQLIKNMIFTFLICSMIVFICLLPIAARSGYLGGAILTIALMIVSGIGFFSLSTITMFLTLHKTIRNTTIYRLLAFYLGPCIVSVYLLIFFPTASIVAFAMTILFLIPHSIFYMSFCRNFLDEDLSWQEDD